MSTTSVQKRRGTAEPRWGWSGVAQIISAELSTADIERLRAALPDHQSPLCGAAGLNDRITWLPVGDLKPFPGTLGDIPRLRSPG